MALSSTDLRYNQAIQAMQQFFGDKDQIDHNDITEYTTQTGNKVPAKFWNIARVSRGVFSLQNATIKDTGGSEEQQHQVVEFPTKPTVVIQKHAVTPTGTISKFVYDEMIPQIKDTYVEWGHYKTVELLLKSNKFFTLYITGDSGSGKNEMIAHACAKLNRPLVRVSMTRETKEEHLIGSKTLLDGSIVYEEGPVVWAAENGAVLLVDEISCLSEEESIRVGTVNDYQSTKLKSLEIGKEYPMPSFNQQTGKFENDIGFIVQDSEKELYEVELEDGRKIVLTSDHPFICSNDSNNFFELSIDNGLKVGDLVVISSDSIK